jgi:hypothetical protein
MMHDRVRPVRARARIVGACVVSEAGREQWQAVQPISPPDGAATLRFKRGAR